MRVCVYIMLYYQMVIGLLLAEIYLNGNTDYHCFHKRGFIFLLRTQHLLRN